MPLIMRVYTTDNFDLMLADVPVSTADISWALSSSPDWSVKFPSNTHNADQIVEELLVELLLDGQLLLEGVIQDIDRPKAGVQGTISVKGRGRLDDLFEVLADTSFKADNKEFLIILYQLLSVGNWRLGEIGTLLDKTTLVDIDLKDGSTLIEQIRKVIETQLGTFYRRGAANSKGNPSLDVGAFDLDSNVIFTSPPRIDYLGSANPGTNLILSLKESSSSADLIYLLDAIGGQVKDNNSVERRITLFDAWQDDPSLAYDADFPIIEVITAQNYVVLNADLLDSVGGTFNTVDAAGTTDRIMIGSDTGVGTNIWTGWAFRPMPGVFDSIEFFTSAKTGGFDPILPFFTLQYWISEMSILPAAPGYDHYNAIRLYTGTLTFPGDVFPIGLVHLDMSHTGIIFEVGKVYGFAIGFDSFPSVDVYVTMPVYTAIVGTDSGMGYARTDWSFGKVSWSDLDEFSPLRVNTQPPGSISGRQESIEWKQYAPEKTDDPAALADIQAAGATLYQRSIIHLQDRAEKRVSYSMKAIGPDLIPPLGNTVYVSGRSETAYENPGTNRATTLRSNITEDLRIKKLKFQFDAKGSSGDYTLDDSRILSREEAFVSVYDEATRRSKQVEGAIIPLFGGQEMVLETLVIVSTLSDTTLEDGTPALTVTFPYTSPVGRTWGDNLGFPYGDSDIGILIIEVVSEMVNETQTGVVCKIASLGGWSFDRTATVYCYHIWR